MQLILHELDLYEFGYVYARKLSGGNKGKLSVAISLLGNSSILLLDEPSTGMDPRAKRFMWDLLQNVGKQKAMILTTHSMEEAEALSTRLGIMANGKFKGIGTLQHIKAKYGDGYQIGIKITEIEGSFDSGIEDWESVESRLMNGKSYLIGELSGDGLGSNLYADLKNGTLESSGFERWVDFADYGLSLIQTLVKEFGSLNLEEVLENEICLKIS